MSEHVRGYLCAAFKLHEVAQRGQAERRDEQREEYRRARGDEPARSECITRRDGAATLAWRARQAQGREERVRIRQLDGTEHTGRILRIATTDPRSGQPDETTLLLTMAGGQTIQLAEIDLIAPSPPPEHEPVTDRGDPRLAANAHKLGYRGHCLTKSRRWSTTFTALREEREEHVREQLRNGKDAADAQRRLAELEPEQRISRMEFVGVGHLTAADAYLAAQAAARAREHRELARIERDSAPGRRRQRRQRVTRGSVLIGSEHKSGKECE